VASVLILEDDHVIGQMLSELLREAGYQVVGPAALRPHWQAPKPASIRRSDVGAQWT